MSPRPAALRRLDSWAVLLLGVLVTLGVIILLATPGPWHRVVPVAARPPLAPPPPPRDIAVYLKGPGGQGCAGAIWLHVDYDLPQFTAVVVPARLACYQAGAGLQPLATIVDDAGPKAATTALSTSLAVRFGSWLEIDPLSVRTALPGFITQYSRPTHARSLPLTGVWSTKQPSTLALKRQIVYLRALLREGGVADQVNLVAFVNYLLGSRDVSTGLTLQAASAVGAALDLAEDGDFVTTSLPVTVARRGAYERWLAQDRALLTLRLALDADATSPVFGATVGTTAPTPTVEVLTSPLGAMAAVYRNAFAAALRSYGTRGVRVDTVACATPGAATRALSGARRSSLGVVVAVGRTATGVPTAARTRAVLGAALAAVHAAQLPAVVSQAPQAGAGVNGVIAAQATIASLPLSPVASAIAARVAATGTSASPGAAASPSPRATPSESAASGVGSSPAASASASPTTTPSGGSSPAPAAPVGPLTASVVREWAQLDAATFVRAVQPAFFAPRLSAPGLGVTYFRRTITRVVVVGPPAAADRLATVLQVDGWAAQRGSAPAATVGQTTVSYSGADRVLARALAGDLGLPTAQVVRSARAGPLTVVLPG